MNQHRVKIVKSEYIEASDLIKWDVFFYEDSTTQTYVWPSIDLVNSFKIKGKLTKENFYEFCSKIEGKDINLVIDKNVRVPEEKISQKDFSKINKQISDHFDVFKKSVE